MPNNNNSDSLVDRILRGDFTQEFNNDAPDVNPDPDGTETDIQYGDEEEIVEDEEYEEDEEDEEDEGYSPDPDPDFPSDEYCEEYMQENGIETAPEPAMPVGAKYTKFRTDDTPNNSTQEQPKVNTIKNTVNNSNSQPAPKNAAASDAAEGTATTKRRGRPSKLVGHEAEVVRLYGEGVSTKLISEKFACSISSVINCLRAQNVEIRPKGRRKGS
jgi:hypothetical protein